MAREAPEKTGIRCHQLTAMSTVATPAISQAEVTRILTANGIDLSKVAVLAIRGYYLDSMGRPGANDRQIWDDAIVIHSPRGIMAYKANTDPNGYRKGRGTGAEKGMASLVPGIHLYGPGPHKGRAAFRQCERFTVLRDGDPPYRDTGWHAINLHSGGSVSTSSLGCQTLPAATWPEFRSLLTGLLEDFKNPKRKNDLGQSVRSFPYLLIEETARRRGELIVSRRYLPVAQS